MSKSIIFDYKKKEILKSNSFKFEKNIQDIVEENMYQIFRIKFLSSEYSFKDTLRGDGRIDSLGIDDYGRPVIMEYKLSENKKCNKSNIILLRVIKKS